MPQLSGDEDSPEMRNSQPGTQFYYDRALNNSTIYVSINNPLSDYGFESTSAKPIPRWMQYQPGRADNLRNVLPEIGSNLEICSSPVTKVANTRIKLPSATTSGPLDEGTELNATQHVRETARASTSDSFSQDTERQRGSSPVQCSRRPSLISDEPLIRPSSIVGQYVESGQKQSSKSVGLSEKHDPKSRKSSNRLTKLLSVRSATIAPPQVTSPE